MVNQQNGSGGGDAAPFSLRQKIGITLNGTTITADGGAAVLADIGLADVIFNTKSPSVITTQSSPRALLLPATSSLATPLTLFLVGWGTTLTSGAGNISFNGLLVILTFLVTPPSISHQCHPGAGLSPLPTGFCGTGTFLNTGALTATTGAITINSDKLDLIFCQHHRRRPEHHHYWWCWWHRSCCCCSDYLHTSGRWPCRGAITITANEGAMNLDGDLVAGANDGAAMAAMLELSRSLVLVQPRSPLMADHQHRWYWRWR